MQRYFVEKSVQIGDVVTLSTEDMHHLMRVMRAKQGDKVIVVANQIAYEAEVLGDGVQIKAVLERQSSELPIEVTIACGLSKNDKLDTIVQKATECGMHRFIPLALKRDVVKWDDKKAYQRVERLAKIAKEAAEQSHRTVIPEIDLLQNLSNLISKSHQYDVKLIAYEETAKQGSHSVFKEEVLRITNGSRVIIVFGSEGGLTQDEVTQLQNEGFIPCSLGPRILRAETAPIYALSALSYQLELS